MVVLIGHFACIKKHASMWPMEEMILYIAKRTRELGRALTQDEIAKLLRQHVRQTGNQYSKRKLMDCLLSTDDPKIAALKDDADTFELVQLSLRQKPRRTASGVATITIITKPWPCSGNCVFCPSDIFMPKSYLRGEPACARARMNYFDPYLQVATRLIMLARMGHATGKIELIILGGTWNDYPESYRTWFVSECFRALNEVDPYAKDALEKLAELQAPYKALVDDATDTAFSEHLKQVDTDILAGKISYNEGYKKAYGDKAALFDRVREQKATLDELKVQQDINVHAKCRVVGLVFETRPDAVNAKALLHMRALGATKVQIGIQSLDQEILDISGRNMDVADVERAINLLRLFGFKIHTHFMVNLPGSNPARDRKDFERFVSDLRYLPDEIKLYPLALIEGTSLMDDYRQGKWAPYTEGELVSVLVDDVLRTPRYCRISRMIRDFATTDVMAGNDHPNLRQQVEGELESRVLAGDAKVLEIRFREIGEGKQTGELSLLDTPFETVVSHEHFLEFVDETDHIAGFLRLCLPKAEATEAYLSELEDATPLPKDTAMIREVHVYGVAARLGERDSNAQHRGLGTALVERAKEIAKAAGYKQLRVISSVGTRAYYAKLGFRESGLYQEIDL